MVQSMPPQTVSSLQVTTASITRLPLLVENDPPLTTNPPPTEPINNNTNSTASSLTVESGSITSVPSLQVRTEHVSKVPSLDVKPRMSAIERIAAQLQANKAPKIKTEAVSTTGLTNTSPTRRSPDTGTQCLPPSENGSGSAGTVVLPTTNGGSFVTTQTISKVNVPPTVTGTGSVTATPTSYTTAVTTTASTTTAVSHQDVTTVLGKRPRKASTKYEDLEQPSTPVGAILLASNINFVVEFV